MNASMRARSPRRVSTVGRRVVPFVLALTGCLTAGLLFVGVTGHGAPRGAEAPTTSGPPPTTVEAAASLPGTAGLSGTVASATPFTAAQVYVRNVDKRILHMVYTHAGRFRAVGLFPGTYEVRVTATGLESDVQHLVLDAGDTTSLDLSLREMDAATVPDAAGGGQEMPVSRAAAEYRSYDDLYPPGPGRDIAERTCMPCHGGNFLSSRPARREVWEAAIDKMFGTVLSDRSAISYGEGILLVPGRTATLFAGGSRHLGVVSGRALRARYPAAPDPD